MFNERELATILAALRRFQRAGAPADPAELFDGIAPLTPEEIDELSERVNMAGTH